MSGKESLLDDVNQYLQFQKSQIEALPLYTNPLEFHAGTVLDGELISRKGLESRIGERATDAFETLYNKVRRIHQPLLNLMELEDTYVKMLLRQPSIGTRELSGKGTSVARYGSGARINPLLAPEFLGGDSLRTPANETRYGDQLINNFSANTLEQPFKLTRLQAEEELNSFFASLYSMGEHLLLIGNTLRGDDLKQPNKRRTQEAITARDESLGKAYGRFFNGDSAFVNEVMNPRNKFVHGDQRLRLFPQIPKENRPYSGMEYQLRGMDQPAGLLRHPLNVAEQVLPELCELMGKTFESYQRSLEHTRSSRK